MQAFRTSLRTVSRRSISTSPRVCQKSATENLKETADAVNKKAGEAILKGVIEPAEKAADAVKDTVGAGSKKAADLAEDAKGAATNAGYTAEQVKAEAAKKVNNAATEAKKATQ